ncbi:MAG TPA: RNA polymerase sigma factor [Polyangiaceae bacterium]|nr:RNA polymerase sigma factor [Polyangiaceae bacterium]
MDNLDEAVERVLSGDTAAFQRIVEATSGRLVRLSARIVGNVADAEDVVQEAYVKAYKSLVAGQFDRRSRVETWLYRIVVNGSIDAKRARARGAVPTDTIAEMGWDGAANAEARVALAELADLLSELPPDQRAALVLKSVEGFSAAEIAELMGRAEGAVEQLLVRARAGLKKKVEPS